ncbi:MAG TPA: phosphoenolpyruvate carboxylase [Erysipelotrichaceae bacterium]|nr:phosphoenolpyruvate carboxylase [Erysipelotrichaceae bacterium]
MRKLPKSIATQHPDNSVKYITVQHEPDEAIHCLLDQQNGGLGIDEIMVDFEGKLTPYHQTSQIALGLVHLGIVPGRDVFITPRIPNAKKEPIFRQIMSVMSLIETNILAYEHTSIQSIHETIVPMIENGKDVIQTHERINSVIELGNKNYAVQFPLDSILVIPLLESIHSLFHVDQILDDYYRYLKEKGKPVDCLRVMLARSDSALSNGLVASVLSVVEAISKAYNWARKNDVEVAPILGCGALPFRGHLTQENIEEFLKTYEGVRTFTIQSGLRYDHGPLKTKEVIHRINEYDAHLTYPEIDPRNKDLLLESIGIFSKHYILTFIKIIDVVNVVANYIPKNRDRLSSSKTGLSYTREVIDLDELADLVKDPILKEELRQIKTDLHPSIPRAISFTSAMYTIGLPPEFIGTGRGLREVFEKYGDVGVEQLLAFYPSLRADLNFAKKFVNLSTSLDILDESTRNDYILDYDLCCSFLNLDEEINDDVKFYHTLLSATRPILLHILSKQRDLFNDSSEEQKIFNEWICKMAKIRGSLG